MNTRSARFDRLKYFIFAWCLQAVSISAVSQEGEHLKYDAAYQAYTFSDTTILDRSFSNAFFGEPFRRLIFYETVFPGNVQYTNTGRVAFLTQLRLLSSRADTLGFFGEFWSLDFSGVSIESLHINAEAHRLTMQNGLEKPSVIGRLIVADSVSKIVLDSIRINHHLSLSDLQLLEFSAKGTSLPDTIDLVNVDLSRIRSFDLSKAVAPKPVHYLCLYNVDVSKLNYVYANTRLYFPAELMLTFEEKLNVYTDLLAAFANRGRHDSFENLDKEYREFKYTHSGNWYGKVLNFVDRYWWDYGYRKYLIFVNALLLNLIFFLLNIVFYTELIMLVYPIQKFIDVDNYYRKKYSHSRALFFFARLPYVFLYTGHVFWGLKLDIRNVNVDNVALFFYVLLQYVVGLVCLAYVANFIITN